MLIVLQEIHQNTGAIKEGRNHYTTRANNAMTALDYSRYMRLVLQPTEYYMTAELWLWLDWYRTPAGHLIPELEPLKARLKQQMDSLWYVLTIRHRDDLPPLTLKEYNDLCEAFDKKICIPIPCTTEQRVSALSWSLVYQLKYQWCSDHAEGIFDSEVYLNRILLELAADEKIRNLL